jgi:hypothetical protein
MTRRKRAFVLVLGLGVVWCGAPREARAQGAGGYGYTSGVLGNPYANPMLNPFLNPYMTQQSIGRNSTLMYFMAAQAANGGIGSGQLSGVRPAPRGSRSAAVPAQSRMAAEMPLSAGVPGGGAGRYFQRGPSAPQSRSPYFQRHNRYFASNGR